MSRHEQLDVAVLALDVVQVPLWVWLMVVLHRGRRDR